jgi:hypothetical protein
MYLFVNYIYVYKYKQILIYVHYIGARLTCIFFLHPHGTSRVPHFAATELGNQPITYLTPRTRDLIGKLTVQPVSPTPLSLWNPKIHHGVEESPPLVHILNHMGPVHKPEHYIPHINFNRSTVLSYA